MRTEDEYNVSNDVEVTLNRINNLLKQILMKTVIVIESIVIILLLLKIFFNKAEKDVVQALRKYNKTLEDNNKLHEQVYERANTIIKIKDKTILVLEHTIETLKQKLQT